MGGWIFRRISRHPWPSPRAISPATITEHGRDQDGLSPAHGRRLRDVGELLSQTVPDRLFGLHSGQDRPGLIAPELGPDRGLHVLDGEPGIAKDLTHCMLDCGLDVK